MTTPPVVVRQAPTRSELVQAHNDRVSKLQTTHSDGVVILNWTDDRGKHHEQGDIEIWQTTGNRTAVTVSKLGERGLWLGSDESQWWLFDLLEKDRRTLQMGVHEGGEHPGALVVQPLALLDLLGLTPIPQSETEVQDPAYNESLNAWTIESTGRGGRVKYAFDHLTHLPVHIEVLDVDGRAQAVSELSRWESVPVANVAVMARPKMPLTVNMRRLNASEHEASGEIKIAFNQTISTISEQAMKNIFDVDQLIASMRPDFIEHVRADGG